MNEGRKVKYEDRHSRSIIIKKSYYTVKAPKDPPIIL
jgi:hypothetical protein